MPGLKSDDFRCIIIALLAHDLFATPLHNFPDHSLIALAED